MASEVVNIELANKIADLILSRFESLPKNGKPTAKEWTVLSGIVQLTLKELKVVTLGTGTKCLAGNEADLEGFLLRDSHAEVMVRRGFLRYLLSNEDIFVDPREIKLKLRPEISFHFFTTHPPCGDASIFNVGPKRQRLAEGATGARLIDTDLEDTMVQSRGFVRTKPGRGVRTLSVSCTDKMTKWNLMGVQGGSLARLMDPIYLSSYTVIGAAEAADALESALQRWTVLDLRPPFRQSPHKIFAVDREFRYAQKADLSPSPCSIVWIANVQDRPHEVAVSGLKLGVTKKSRDTPKGRLLICKADMLCLFSEKMRKLGIEGAPKKDPQYSKEWQNIKKNVIRSWTKMS